MKKLLSSLMLLVLAISTWAADIIIKMDETRIDAIIVEVSETTIKYRKVSNPEGPLFVIKVEEIASVIYSNGEVQAYNTTPQKSTSRSTQQTDQVLPANQSMTAYDAYWLYKLEEEKKAKEEKARQDSIRAVEQARKDSIRVAEQTRKDSIRLAEQARKDSIRVAEQAKRDSIRAIKAEERKLEKYVFQAHVEFSGMIGGNEYTKAFPTGHPWGGFGFDGIFGFRYPRKFNYLGVGLGFHDQISDDYFSLKGFIWFMPIYLNDRLYFLCSEDVRPFVDLSLGGFIYLGSNRYQENPGGLFVRIGAGVEWKRLNFGVGYQPLVTSYGSIHQAYFKIGYRFG